MPQPRAIFLAHGYYFMPKKLKAKIIFSRGIFWREVDKHEMILEIFISPQTTSLNHGTNNNMLFTE